MTEILTVYILFLLVNGKGGVADGYSTVVECQEARDEAIKDPTTLYASDCFKVELKPIARNTAK